MSPGAQRALIELPRAVWELARQVERLNDNLKKEREPRVAKELSAIGSELLSLIVKEKKDEPDTGGTGETPVQKT
jgi:hypothetical protein